MKKAVIATSFPVALSPVTGHGRDIGQWKINTPTMSSPPQSIDPGLILRTLIPFLFGDMPFSAPNTSKLSDFFDNPVWEITSNKPMLGRACVVASRIQQQYQL
jgi:hypothetical protein